MAVIMSLLLLVGLVCRGGLTLAAHSQVFKEAAIP